MRKALTTLVAAAGLTIGLAAPAQADPPPSKVLSQAYATTSRGGGTLWASWLRSDRSASKRTLNVTAATAISYAGRTYPRLYVDIIQGRTQWRRPSTSYPAGLGSFTNDWVPRTKTGTITLVRTTYSSGHTATVRVDTSL